MSKVSIVVPNYNGIKYVETCFDALRKQTMQDVEIWMIDNGSTDGSRELVQEKYPEVQVAELGENTGFCGAVNVGIKRSNSPYVLLLNNDTQATETFVEKLYQAIEKDEKIFSCSAKMLQYHNREAIDDAGDFYCALGWAYARGKGAPAGKYDREGDIFFSCAGAAIYRKEILDRIGYFDENHFAYLEDADIGYRARIQGFKNRYIPEAVVYHVGSASSGSVYNLFKTRYSSRNSIYLIYKNMPLLQIILNLPLFIPGFLVKTLFFMLKGYGKEYVAGIGRGFVLSRKGKKEGKKIAFQWKNAGNYIIIQWELWVNIVRRFLK